jgi:hypothetical protein
MKHRTVPGLRSGRKLLLASAGWAALGGAFLVRARSQSGDGSGASFEVVSIKPHRCAEQRVQTIHRRPTRRHQHHSQDVDRLCL